MQSGGVVGLGWETYHQSTPGGVRDGGGDVRDLRFDDVDEVRAVAGERLCEL